MSNPTSNSSNSVAMGFTFWAFYIAIMAGCIWAVSTAWEAGWVIGFPIAIAIGTTKIAFFDD